MSECHAHFLKAIVLERKLDLLKFRKETGGSIMDNGFIAQCDEIIKELDKLLEIN